MAENLFYGNYAPNAIFRNQPNYTYFNEAINMPNNPLFRCLNEIDEFFMCPKNSNTDQNERLCYVDPRTNEIVDERYIDVNLSRKTNSFNINIGSSLTYIEHKRGIDYIFNRQRNHDILESDRNFWTNIQEKVFEENLKFAKVFRDYCLKHKDIIYESSKKFVKLYQMWYKKRILSLKEKYLNETYNTYMGLLHARNYTTTNDCKMQISNVEILEESGEVIKMTDNSFDENQQFNVKLGFRNIDIFAFIYAEDQMNSIDPSEKFQIEEHIIRSFENYEKNGISSVPFTIAMPTTSLLFILTSGDYDDIPTEMVFYVKQQNSGQQKFPNGQKYIVMDEPLPARDCGWHTNNLILEQIVVARLSTLNQKDANNSKFEESINNKNLDTIDNRNNTQCNRKYTLVECDEYMKNCKQKQPNRCKFQQFLSKWTLHSKKEDKIDKRNINDHAINNNNNNDNRDNIDIGDDTIDVYTIIDASMSYTNNDEDVSSTSNDSNNQEFYSYSTKLEYNVEYGCEVMTKYELIREWFYLKLMKNSGKRICYRFDVDSCDLFSEELMTLEGIEDCLKSLYNIDMNVMLIKLMKFLKMLKNLPNDQYLLRYNLRFTDKLLICSRSKEVSTFTFHLHSLLDKEPNNLLFLSKDNFLEISPAVCSRMHLDHIIMPCCFKAGITKTLSNNGGEKLSRSPVALFNDRERILKRIVNKRKTVSKRKKKKTKKKISKNIS